jgi:hypothetical protein
MLRDRDARTLARLRARQRWLLAAGALLFVQRPLLGIFRRLGA